jgi:hypothetical protein
MKTYFDHKIKNHKLLFKKVGDAVTIVAKWWGHAEGGGGERN